MYTILLIRIVPRKADAPLLLTERDQFLKLDRWDAHAGRITKPIREHKFLRFSW